VWLYKGERVTPRTGREEEYRQPRRASGGGDRDRGDRGDRPQGPRGARQ